MHSMEGKNSNACSDSDSYYLTLEYSRTFHINKIRYMGMECNEERLPQGENVVIPETVAVRVRRWVPVLAHWVSVGKDLPLFLVKTQFPCL